MAPEPSAQPKLIVWTLRRTGGTTLQRILGLAYPEGRVFAEPFNWDRAFGQESRRFAQSGTPAEFYQSMLPHFEQPLAIKHCVELMQRKVNAAIVSTSVLQEFKHVLLYRRNELNRIRSLVIAESTGFWGQSRVDAYDEYLQTKPGMPRPVDYRRTMKIVDFGIEQLRAVRTVLLELGLPLVELRLEDLYLDGPDRAFEILETELTGIGLDLRGIRTKAALNRLEKGKQNSSKLMRWVPNAADFENLDEQRPELEDITDFVRGMRTLPALAA